MSDQQVQVIEREFQAPAAQDMGDPRSVMRLPGVNNVTAAAEMARAIAEVRGKIEVARACPRNEQAAFQKIMASCAIPAMAAVAFYKVPRGGGSVTGPSIRFAEECVRVLGNFEFGHQEFERGEDQSVVQVFAWDVETNVRRTRQLIIPHYIDTKNGPKKCRDHKEIDDLISNKASKQARALILSLVPVWLKEQALEQCRQTIAGNSKKPMEQRVRDMLQAFATYGVTVEMIEVYLEHPLKDATVDDLVVLHGVFNALKEGDKVAEHFGAKDDEAQATGGDKADKIANAATTGDKPKAAKAKAAPPPAQEAEAPQEPSPPAAEPAPPPPAEEPSPPTVNEEPPPPAEAQAQDPATPPEDMF